MSMRHVLRRTGSLAVLVLAGSAFAATPARAAQTRNVDLHVPLTAGSTLEIDDINGAIVATPVAGGMVTVHAHAATSGADPGPVVRTSRTGNRLVVCAVFPGDDAGDTKGCSQHHDGRDNEDLTIDLHIGVPRGVHVTAHNVNGSISATGFDAPVDVSNVSGAVTIATTSTANVSTVNGSISAHFSGHDDARFRTVNGPVDLVVPRDADAAFRAKTLNGSISADGIHLNTQNGQFVGHTATATLGGGHGHISVVTVNGSVHLERR